jgi:DNA-binding response OmpR family regulator
VILSADPDPHAATRMLDLGAADYIVKPFTIDSFLATVARALAAHRGLASPKQGA